MNKTKIEWTDYSWNPVTGCKHGCWYCYAKRLAEGKLRHLYPQGFEPTFWPERLGEPARVKEPSKIFVCSMADLFGEWVPGEWIEAVMEVVQANPRHTFQFLTKNPGRYKEFDWPENAWLGVTIDFDQRWADSWDSMLHLIDNVRFISFEPLLGHHLEGLGTIFDCPPEWIIIGAMTGHDAVKPQTEWVEDIIRRADEVKVPVFLKDNLGELRDEFDYRQEWPR